MEGILGLKKEDRTKTCILCTNQQGVTPLIAKTGSIANTDIDLC